MQIWASSFLPDEPRIEDNQQAKYYEKTNFPMLLEYLNEEIKRQVCTSKNKKFPKNRFRKNVTS